jgi:glucose-1-phosphate thymidylyltransferase
MKGILLAGGLGSRLNPLTLVASKQLLPVYDKPLVFYPLSTLMLAGIKDILVITTPQQQPLFKKILGSGKDLGITLSYEVQEKPLGIAHSFLVGSSFIKNEKVALILGDNLFHGTGLGRSLKQFSYLKGAQIFGYQVNNPSSYGVASLDSLGKIISLEEKPTNSNSKIAIPGLYFFDETVVGRTKKLIPSARKEIEIIDLLSSYLDDSLLNLDILPRGTAWFDSGTFEDLYDASTYVRLIQLRTGEIVGDPKTIARVQGWINDSI